MPTPAPPARRRLSSVLHAAALWPLLLAPAAWGQGRAEVKQVDWGFGGQVSPGHFAPVSVLVDNPTQGTFDGTLTLYRSNFVGDRRGATLSQPIFLSAFAERRAPFYVFPLDANEQWVLEIAAADPDAAGDAPRRVTLPRPGFGPPRLVVLTGTDDIAARLPKVARMDESLFPPNPAACDGLRAVVLDHAPAWGEVRRASFAAWVNAGGTVHLLPGPDGEPPRFRADLAPLNDPAGRFAVGRGRVVRHPHRRGEFTAPMAETLLLPDAAAAPVTVEDRDFAARRKERVGSFPLDYDPSRIEDDILSTLRRMVRPEHSWGLIHVMCLAYVAALFPGVFLVGRERRGYPATLGLLVAVTVAFGWGLQSVGRRGYGESLSVRSTALARALPDGRTVVSQWSDAFVTDGGDYALSVPGGPVLISTAQDAEPVKGRIVNGPGGMLAVDVPPYSSRAFVAKNLRDAPAPPVESLGGSTGRTPDGRGVRLTTLRLKIPAELNGAFRLLAVHGRRCYPLRRVPGRDGAGGGAELSGEGFPLSNLLAGYGVGLLPGVNVQTDPYGGGRNDYVDYVDRFGEYGAEVDLEKFRDRGLDAAGRHVIGQDLGLTDDDDLYTLSAPAGRVRVYVVGPLRPEHRVLGAPGSEPPAEPLPNQLGTTIFAYEFPL